MPTTFVDSEPTSVCDSERAWLYRGWVNVVLAALAMTATLPGRTHGLGLITKSLTADPTLGIGEGLFSVLNFWAIVVGAVLCVPTGRLIDRFGVRSVLVGVAVALGLAVLAMSGSSDVYVLFLTLTLVRGLGQGALSIVSMAMVGKWFTRQLPIAMGVFAVLLAVGFIAATFAVGEPVQVYGWRLTWAGVGVFLLTVLAPLGGLLVRSTPEAVAVVADRLSPQVASSTSSASLAAALSSPAFWAFTLATSFFNMAWSAITLFNELILEKQGFGHETYLVVMGILMLAGLPANLICGWLGTRWPMGRLLCIGMMLLAGSLAVFPYLTGTLHVVLYGAVLGASGGIITVVFFAFYGHAFGRRQLGAIQAAAQVVTVLASALGPVLLQVVQHATGSYHLFFLIASPVAAILGMVVWLVHLSPPGEQHTVIRKEQP